MGHVSLFRIRGYYYNVIGRFYAHPKIVSRMVEHSVARAKYGLLMRSAFRVFGPALIRFFGFPLDMEVQRRARPLNRLLDVRGGERVLDVGCGVGYFTFEAVRLCRRRVRGPEECYAVGLDIDREDVGLARHAGRINHAENASFTQGNGLMLPFKNASFDKVLASEIIEHIHDDVSFLRELARVLKPGGTLVVTTPYDSSPVEYKQEHYKKIKRVHILGGHVRSGYSLGSITEKLENASFTVTEHAFSYGRYTKLARGIIKRLQWVGAPIAWSVSWLEDFTDVKDGKCIIVSARKHRNLSS